MIIGQFCDVYPPETDGVGMVVKNYVEQLNRMNHECYYISPKMPGCKAKQDFTTFQFFSIKIAGVEYRAGMPLIDFPFRKRLKSINFDIIHSHSPFSAGHEAVRIAKKRNIPVVGTFHSKYYDDFYRKTHSKILAKTGLKYVIDFYNSCDEVWAVNNATGDVLKSYGFKKEIKIMPNGTNIWIPNDKDISLADQKFGLGKLGKEKSVFLFVGQQNWKKNIEHLIKAIKIYSSETPDFIMIVAGKGPDEEEIKKLVENLGLTDKFLFTGHISDRNLLMSLYFRANLFLFPSLYDNAPLVVREAAAVGTPSVLIKNTCSAEGITNNYNGFLCEDTPQSIASCIKSALPLSKEVGQNAKKTIPIPWNTVLEAAIDRYKVLIKNNNAVLINK